MSEFQNSLKARVQNWMTLIIYDAIDSTYSTRIASQPEWVLLTSLLDLLDSAA